MPRITHPWRPVGIGAAIGLLCAAAFASGMFGSWSARITDRLFLPHPSSPLVTVVAIDDVSIAQLGRWPWPRKTHAELIRQLSKAGAKVVAYDVNFPEASDAADDEALVAALKEAGNVVLPVELKLSLNDKGLVFDPEKSLPPLPNIAQAAAAVGHSNTPPEVDGIFRKYAMYVSSPSGYLLPSFVTEALRLFGQRLDTGDAHLDGLDRMRVNYPDYPLKGFRLFHAVDVVRGTADLSAVAGGAVFVGSTAEDLHDSLLVPTSYGKPMPGVEVHASAFDTVLQRRWLMPVPIWTVVLLLLTLGTLAGLAASRFRTLWAVLLLAASLLGVAVAGFSLFDAGYVLDLAWPMLALLLSYGAATVERRLSSDKERKQVKLAFTRYVSKSVVDSIMRDPSKLRLGGERRHMTVLFSDIRGFTSISEKLDPDALVATLNTYLSRMTDIVFAHDGVLDKYIGDAVMAFWNAPLEQKDHSVRAVETALDMQNALAEMNRDKLFGDVSIGIGVGVNTGEMIVGNIGSQVRFEYTVIGDSVNLASRLEALTRQYDIGIIVTKEVMAELGEGYLTRRLDKVAVKGKKEPVFIYEVMARMSQAVPWQLKMAKDFEVAMDAYFSGDFVKTEALAKDLLGLHADDGPSKLLLERARHFQKEPPPSGWDGTWVYLKK